jgi:hypothetical protein
MRRHWAMGMMASGFVQSRAAIHFHDEVKRPENNHEQNYYDG